MTLPTNQRASAVGVDSKKEPILAGANLRPEVLLVLAQADSSASATLNTPFRVYQDSAYGAEYGEGSPFALALDMVFNTNNKLEVWGLPVGDPAVGVAADSSITVSSGTVTKSFTGFIKTKGIEIPFVGIKGTDQDDVAANILSALTAEIKTPFDASITTANIVDLLAKFEGVHGNDITIDVYDSNGNIITAGSYGVGITVSAFSNGAGLVDVSTAVNNIPDSIKVTRIINQFSDSTALGLVEDLGIERRDPELAERVRSYYGVIVDTTSKTTIANAVTSLKSLADARINDSINSLLPVGAGGLAVEFVAELVTRIAARYQVNPGQPPRGLQMLNSINAPKSIYWFNSTQRNELYIGGVSNFEYNNGTFRIMDLCNLYHPAGDTKLSANQPIEKDDEDVTAIANMCYDIKTIFSNDPWLSVKFIEDADISSNSSSKKLSDVEATIDNRIDVYVDNLFIKDSKFAKDNKEVNFDSINKERVNVKLVGKLASTGRVYDFDLSLFKG